MIKNQTHSIINHLLTIPSHLEKIIFSDPRHYYKCTVTIIRFKQFNLILYFTK